MTSEHDRPARALVIALGVAGVVVSWAYFLSSTAEHGFVASWMGAFTSHPFSQGLHWDLVFSDLVIITIAVLERERIGWRFVVGTIAAGIVLGVCAAIPVYWIGARRASR